METEIFKPIEEFPNYMVSNFGNVKGIRGYILKPSINDNGYYIITIKKCTRKIHRLVAITFLPNILKLLEINHIDGNKLNNNIDNLEWCTGEYNRTHYEVALNKYNKNSKKLNDEQISKIKEELDIIQTEYKYHQYGITKKYKELAEKYSVKITTIRSIINNTY